MVDIKKKERLANEHRYIDAKMRYYNAMRQVYELLCQSANIEHEIVEAKSNLEEKQE